jgi:8-oxo-dGTP pyrophosphatase MutT (NUDIX family)
MAKTPLADESCRASFARAKSLLRKFRYSCWSQRTFYQKRAFVAKLPRMAQKYDSGRELIARVILIHDNCLLVNQDFSKKLGQHYMALPGGHVDPGESCAHAVARECKEELQIEIRVGDARFISEQIYAGRSQDDKPRHELTLVFEGELVTLPKTEGDKVLSPEPSKNFRWLPLAQLPDAPLLPTSIKQFLLNEDTSARYAFADETK